MNCYDSLPEALSDTQNVTYAVGQCGKDGRFAKTPFFTLYADASTSRHDNPEHGYFRYTLPKVNGDLLEGIRGFFRKVSDRYGLEAYAEIWYRPDVKRYEVVIPSQECGSTFVTYGGMPESEDFYKVFSLHSHNVMQAFISGIDDADERRTLIYGVFGGFGGTEKALFRACCGGGYYSYIQQKSFVDGVVTFGSAELAEELLTRWQTVAVGAR